MVKTDARQTTEMIAWDELVGSKSAREFMQESVNHDVPYTDAEIHDAVVTYVAGLPGWSTDFHPDAHAPYTDVELLEGYIQRWMRVEIAVGVEPEPVTRQTRLRPSTVERLKTLQKKHRLATIDDAIVMLLDHHSE